MNQKGFSNIVLVIILAVVLVGAGGYFVITRNKTQLRNEDPKDIARQKEIVDGSTSYVGKIPLCGEEELLDERLTNNQIIWYLDITPQVISTTKQVEVMFKADVGDSPALIPESVELLRFNKNMEVTKSYGKMEDKGSDKVDPSRKTRIFTLKVHLNESLPDSADPWKSLIRFGVAAEYKGLPCKSFYGLGIHGGGTADNYIWVVPSSISPEEMFAQLADELERRDFATVQKHFTDKPQNQKLKEFFEKLDNAKIQAFADGLRNAKLIQNYDEEMRIYEMVFEGRRGEIRLQHGGNGEWLIDGF